MRDSEEYRIAIADDDRDFRAQAARLVRRVFDEAGERVRVTEYISGRGLQAELAQGNVFDLYLLDIEMPGADGLELAGQIHRAVPDAYVILITSHEKYALQGYSRHVYHYILKDDWERLLPGTLEEIREALAGQRERCYFIRSERRYQKIRLSDILYLEKEPWGKNVLFHCRNGITYAERAALKKVYEKLPEEEFVYIQRSRIVNLRHVEGESKGEICLTGGVRLSVSQELLPAVRKSLAGYWRRI